MNTYRREFSQRDVMRDLKDRLGDDEELVVQAYATMERRGEVDRKSNSHGWTPEKYARALWNDGTKKGWL